MAYKGKRINPQKFERGQIKIIAILLPLVIFMALPIVFIANHAFKPMDELFAFPPTFFVRNATLENFTKLIKFSRTAGVPLSRYVFNSLLVTGLTVGLSLLFTTFAAFALAKLKFKGRQLMMDINQLALMFVATAVLIPRYLVICKVGLIDSIWAHILPLLAPLHFLDRARHACLNHLRLRRVDQAEGNLLQDISKRRLIIHAGQFVFFNIRF